MQRFLLIIFLTVQLVFGVERGIVKGIISDNYDPLPMANIILDGTTIGTSSGFQGEFTLNNVPTGKHTILVKYLGYETKKIDIELKSNQVLNIGNILLNQDAKILNEVVVEATMSHSQAKALMIQKGSNGIVNAIAADRIGKLPDRNAAEAVQRISGVSIERDQGEGRFVAVRGLPSEWNSTTINGNRIPTAEEETVSRATAFDFFPSDMIQYVIVSKAITPDQEADAMGGNVNFITRTAPDQRTLNFTVGGGYNQKSEGPIASLNLLYGNRTDDGKFGFIINGSYWKRKWATDNYEPRRGKDGIGIYRLELRDYSGTRETIGFNGAAEYKFNETNKLTFKGIYGTLSDDELHYKHRLRFDKNRIELQNIHDILNTRLYGGELGGDHFLSEKLLLDWNIAHYDNVFEYGNVPNSADNSYYLTRFSQRDVGYTGLENRDTGKKYAYNKIDGGKDPWNKISTHLGKNFTFDPTKARFDYLELYKVYVNERDKIIVNTDFKYTHSDKLKIKFGGKFRDKERIAKFSDEFYVWNKKTGVPAPYLSDLLLMTQPGKNDYLSEIGSPYRNLFNKVLDKETNDGFWKKFRKYLVLDKGESALMENGGALGRTFDLYEKHYSGYVMSNYKINNKVSIVGGMRLSYTDLEVKGHTYLAAQKKLVKSVNNKSYLLFLPMLHIKYSPNSDMNIRVAVTKTFTRPDFGYLSPGGTYMEVDNSYTSGNPELDPTYSWNFDLTGEYYFGNLDLITAGLFYKKITDPIFKSRAVGTFNGKSGVTFNRPENGGDAILFGLELGINKKFDFLPGFLNGFGIEANYTYMNSEMKIISGSKTRKTKIPRQADNLINLSLYYEKAGFDARIAMNHKDDYITAHGSSNMLDEYYGKYTSMDISASYAINNWLVVYSEMNNILNEPMIYYLGNKNRPLQVEYYGLRGQTGVKINLF